MTLAVNEPSDQRMVSELPSYIREDRVAINALSGGGNVGVTDLSVALGTTSLTIGVDIGVYGLESLITTGLGASTLATISGGTDGQIKVFIFQDSNIEIGDSTSKTGGTFYLNHLPAGSNFAPDQDDILALVNIGGDGATAHGYWKELFRTLSVK